MHFTLIGWPLGHSLSPVFQNIAIQENGLSGEYSLLPVSPDQDLGRVLAGLRANPEWAGGNITVPYKEKVIPFLDGLEGAAKKLQAVNTLVRRGDRLIGQNTDLPGFLFDLDRHGMKPDGGAALVIGSGGAARAVVLGLAECGCAISILAVLPDQAQALVRELRLENARVGSWREAEMRERARAAKWIVNTSPVGMWPEVDATPWPADMPFPSAAAAYDVIYNPVETRFLRDARGAGLRTASGLGMLVEQGALAFEIWTGCQAPRERMLRAAQAAMLAGG
jgi:shikimate dehydrogenase